MFHFCSQEVEETLPLKLTNTWIGGNTRVTLAYLAYRWFLAIFFLFGLLQSLVQNTLHFLSVGDTENVYKYFIYLTNNGRLLAVLAFTVEASLVTLRWRKENRGGSLRDQPGLRYRISWVLTNINSSFSVLISTVYWAALYTPDKHEEDFENFSGHLLIALVCLLDVWISDRPWQLHHALHPIVFGAGFGVFSLVFHFLGGTNYYGEPYIYYILDWNKPARTSLVIGGVLIFLVLIHLVYFLMATARTAISARRDLEDNTCPVAC